MKALLYRYGSICEPDLLEAFQILGVETIEITEEISNKKLSPSECVALLNKELQLHPVDFVFSINFFPAVSEVCNIYHIPYLCLIVDSPVMELYSSSVQNECNRIFIFDSLLTEEIKRFNPDHVWYLPLATNTTRIQKFITDSSIDTRNSFSSSVSFVGSLYTEKCPYDKLTNPSPYLKGYLEGLMEAQLKVYGYYFVEEVLTEDVIKEFSSCLPGFYHLPGENFLTDRITMAQLYMGSKISAMERVRVMELLSPHFPVTIFTGSDTSAYPSLTNRGLAKTLTEMPLIFHESQINLNITAKSIRNGLPLRIWDILGSGGFCMTNSQNDLQGLLTPGVHLDTYGSLEELEDKTAYYLEHPKLASEIAMEGFLEVQKNHSWHLRLLSLMELAFSVKTS